MSNLDTSNFERKTLEAVEALRKGETQTFEEALRRSFELLAEAKQYFFPTAMKMVDLTRLSPATCGAPLAELLLRRRTRDEKTNLLLPTFYLDKMEREYPETFTLLREEIAAGRVQIIGGDRDESPLYLLPQVEAVDRLLLGLLFYQEKLGIRPQTFGRNAAGYTPILPQLLKLTGFESSLLFSGDGWRPNRENQSRLHWQGHDRTRLPTLARNPVDAESDKCFMELADRIGYGANSDLAMTSVFEHRPGYERPWLGDIFRSNRYARVLGETVDLAEFFRLTESSGMKKRFEKDDFRTNFLTRAGKEGRPNPVSAWRDFYRLREEMAALAATTLFAALHSSKRQFERLDGFARLSKEARPLGELKTALGELLFEPLLPPDEETEESARKKEERQNAQTLKKRADAVAALENETSPENRQKGNVLAAETLVWELTSADVRRNRSDKSDRSDKSNRSDKSSGSDSATGLFLVNASSREKTMEITRPLGELDPETAPLVRVSESPDTPSVVTCPAFSALWLPTLATPEESLPKDSLNKESEKSEKTSVSPKKRGLFARIFSAAKSGTSNAEAQRGMIESLSETLPDGTRERFYLMRNRFFTLKVDAVTGALRSLRTFSTPTIRANRGILRQPAMGNRLSVQAALRLSEAQKRSDGRDPESAAFGYTMMAADRVTPFENGETARLVIDGRLMTPEGVKAADFTETIQIRARSRVIEFEVAFQPILLPTDKAWENYYGVRFAWNDSMAEVQPGLHGTLWETTRDYLQAPEAVVIESEPEVGLTILSGGLPFFRRYGLRRMDAVLIPKNESARRFRFGVGVDLTDPLGAAQTFLAPEPFALPETPRPKKPLFRFLDVTPNSAAVLLLEPLLEARTVTPSDSANDASPADSAALENADAPLDGFRLVLQETSGSKTVCRVRSRLPIRSVTKTDFLQRPVAPLTPDDAQSFTVELLPHEVLPLEIRLKF